MTNLNNVEGSVISTFVHMVGLEPSTSLIADVDLQNIDLPPVTCDKNPAYCPGRENSNLTFFRFQIKDPLTSTKETTNKYQDLIEKMQDELDEATDVYKQKKTMDREAWIKSYKGGREFFKVILQDTF